MLVFSLLSPMGEREAQVSQPGTGRAEWGWREDPKVKSKPEAGHKGPRGFDDTRLPPTGPILAGPCLPLAVSTSEPWRGQAQGDVRGGRAQGVPLAPRLLLQHCGHTPPARVVLACCSSLQVCLQKCPLHQSLYPQTSTPQSFIATSFIFLVIPFYHLAGFIFLVYLICYFHR